SHQPASRAGIALAVPDDATGSTYASRAAVEAEAALGPAMPAKKMANVTGIVTTAASQVLPLTSVPVTSAMLPATARPRWAIALVLRSPPKEAKTSAPKLPKTARTAICGLPMTLKVTAKMPGTTMHARTARIAASVDQVGRAYSSHARPVRL